MYAIKHSNGKFLRHDQYRGAVLSKNPHLVSTQKQAAAILSLMFSELREDISHSADIVKSYSLQMVSLIKKIAKLEDSILVLQDQPPYRLVVEKMNKAIRSLASRKDDLNRSKNNLKYHSKHLDLMYLILNSAPPKIVTL